MKKVLLFVVFATLLLSACAKDTVRSTTYPGTGVESDWGDPLTTDESINSGAVVDGNGFYDPNLYRLTVRVGGESKDHTELHGSGSSWSVNGTGGGSVSFWQDGKGIIPAEVKSIQPSPGFIRVGDNVVLKSEDLKLGRVQDGWVIDVKCRIDYEPVKNLGVVGEVNDARDVQTWELDDCRWVDGVFEIEDSINATP
jgi:hypothetical protein